MVQSEMVASKARVKFMEMVRETLKGRRFFIHHASGADAVLISDKEYKLLIATQRLFNDPDRMARIQKARKAIANGKGGKLSDLIKETSSV